MILFWPESVNKWRPKLKIKELVDFLQKQDPDGEVFLSSDEEGNSYHPIADIEEAQGSATQIVLIPDSSELWDYEEILKGDEGTDKFELVKQQ